MPSSAAKASISDELLRQSGRASGMTWVEASRNSRLEMRHDEVQTLLTKARNGLISKPTESTPRSEATMQVVPAPQNGSRTGPPVGWRSSQSRTKAGEKL